ncbi:MAG TPA: ABC transporter permease [Chitinophagaceae bacterium]|nr:ABC transporter permease [Chitinophagaceae bacterium]
MNKILLIIQREYLTRVRKKSFLLTTILVPLIIIGFYAAIFAIAVSDDSAREKVAIVDDAGLFDAAAMADKGKDTSVTFHLVANETKESFKKKYHEQGYTAFVYIPAIDLNDPKGIELYSRAAVSLGTKDKIEDKITRAVELKRLAAANIDPSKYESIKANVRVESRIDSGAGGEKKSAEEAAYIVAFAAGLLIYMVLLIYGSMVMRGVMEEKTNRISEVIVSSVKPFQLMFGKIIGIGAVGLTQFFIWIILIGALQLVIPALMGSEMQPPTGADTEAVQQAKSSFMNDFSENMESIPMGMLAFAFVFYFIGGYLMYASMFAAIGSVSEDQQDAQQLIFPVMMPIILGFVIMVKAAKEPHSGLALFGSLFPLTSPIVMIGRIPFGVPLWQIITSMLLLVLFFVFCTWLAGRIYRTGILMYGKKGSWKEMLKWAFKRY